jgi:hypothetical protein
MASKAGYWTSKHLDDQISGDETLFLEHKCSPPIMQTALKKGLSCLAGIPCALSGLSSAAQQLL